MRSTPRAAFAARAVALLSLFSTSIIASPALGEDSSNSLVRRALQPVGCFSSSGSLTAADTHIYQTSSYCAQTECANSAVIGLVNGNGCYCGDSLPPNSTQVSPSNCGVPCTGYGQDTCGGHGFYQVYITGVGTLVSNGDSSSSSSSSTSTTPTSSTDPTVVVGTSTSVNPNQTIFVTQTASSSASNNGSNGSSGGGGGSNTAGIAAGVVVGIVVLAAICGGGYFYLRRRRQLAIEEQHRQRSQVSDFFAGSGSGAMGHERKGLGSSYSHRSDARLDPEVGGMRRNSAGSFVEDDSHDYSRKVLRVANPDSS